MKRPLEGHHPKYAGAKEAMKSPKRVVMKSSNEEKELIDINSSSFSPRCLFPLPSNSSAVDSLLVANDQEVLLDVPSNSSFAQAELLLPTSNFAPQASTSSCSVYPHLVRP